MANLANGTSDRDYNIASHKLDGGSLSLKLSGLKVNP